MSAIDRRTIQTYLQHGMGQLILDTALLIVGRQVVSLDQFVVSVRVTSIILSEQETVPGERILVSTVVDNPLGKQVYGISLHDAAPDESFLLFLRDDGRNFTLAQVSNPQTILLGCFKVQTEEHLTMFVEAMRLLDRYLMPEGSSLAFDFPTEPSLPGCDGCLFLMHARAAEPDGAQVYRCGRIWTPASLHGWLPRDLLEKYGDEYGQERPICWTRL